MLEERDPDLDEEDYIKIANIGKEHWRGVAEDNEDRSNINSLKWDVLKIYKEDLIKRYFLFSIQHKKGGNIVWTCVKDHIIK